MCARLHILSLSRSLYYGKAARSQAFQKAAQAIKAIPLTEVPTTSTGKGEWTNHDIDEVFKELGLIATPATWILTAHHSPEMGESEFQHAFNEMQNSTQPFLPITLWIRHHWLIIFLQGNTIYVADSAPGVATRRDISAVADLIASSLNVPITILRLHSMRQPPSSVECGLHVIINTLLFEANLLTPAKGSDFNFVSYEPLQSPLQLLLAKHISKPSHVLFFHFSRRMKLLFLTATKH